MASVVHVEGDTEITRNSLGEWTIRHLDGLTMKKLTSTDRVICRLVDSFGLTDGTAKRAVKKILKAS